ncbi:MAG TPA: Hsp20/alpha crystallin family protein [Solirubrobacterales bacterium]|nr:Hsp20/alpha crystallin family protein [Solirubrobacterales bacterium]
MPTEIAEWRPLSELRHRVDQMFRDVAADNGLGAWSLSMDVIRRDDAIVIRADIPGIKREDVEIAVEDGVLTVSGKHEEEHDETKGHYVRRERHYGSFSRSLTLPRGVKPEDIQATTADGVLEVTIPLPKDEAKKVVEIKAGSDGSSGDGD